MRFLFWLLLILNVGALVYFNMDLIAPPPVSTAKPEISPEKMKLLSDSEVETMPKRQATSLPASVPQAANEPMACYEWSSFEPTKLNDVMVVVNALSIKSNVKQQATNEAVKYWVYKPPLPSAEAAQSKAEELKALGITDFFIVQDSKWRNAISFGVFRDEQLAINLMNDLRHRGVREVVKSVRNKGDGHSTIVLEGVTPTLLEQLKKNQPDFPDTEIKDALCPIS